MISVISGNNKIQLLNFVTQRKQKAKNSNYLIYSFEITDIGLDKLIDIIYSNELFYSSKKLVIIYINEKYIKVFNDEFLNRIKLANDVDLYIVITSKTNKYEKFDLSFRKSKQYRNLLRYATEMKFDIPKNYSNFNISDSLLIEKDTKKALQLLLQNNELDVLTVIATLQNTLRSYISYKYNNDTYKKLHPFVKSKVAKIKLTKSQTLLIYERLNAFELNLKRNNFSAVSNFIDFVINLY